MRLKNVLIVVKDIERSKKFYHDLFGLDVVVDNDGNMILTEGLVLQEKSIWEKFLGKEVIPENNSCELYFEERNIEAFARKLDAYDPPVQYVNQLMTHSWGQKVIRLYDPDGNLIEVGTPMEADLSADMLSDTPSDIPFEAPSDIPLGEPHSIDTVVFDIGMVLKGWHPQLEKFFGREAAAIVEDAIWGRGYWEEMDRGIVDEEVLMNLMAAAAPEYEQQIRYILDHLELISERYDYAIPWVKELKEAGFHVYYLSNYSRRLREKVPQTIDFLSYMDGGVFSCDVKLMKPDQNIYQLLCEKYDLTPERCLFIDDRQENVNAAKQFGMQAVRFDGYEKSYGRIMELLGF